MSRQGDADIATVRHASARAPLVPCAWLVSDAAPLTGMPDPLGPELLLAKMAGEAELLV